MSWRFRKSFQAIPGVRLNLTSRGLSATVGGSPLSFNIGPGGTHANVSIPGTGIHNRIRLSALENSGPHTRDDHLSAMPEPVVNAAAVPIESASTYELTSASLAELQSLLQTTREQRDEIAAELADAKRNQDQSRQRFNSWTCRVILKNFFKKSYAERSTNLETADQYVAELESQLSLTKVAAQIDLEPRTAEAYFRMRDAFARLSESHKLWDTLSRQNVDRFRTRSAADVAVDRSPVAFAIAGSDIFEWQNTVPFLPNANGGDIYVYPAVLLYRASRILFALIDAKDVEVTVLQSKFIEASESDVPRDSQIISHAWAKSNKDGSPDRRFRDNYQMPVVQYAVICLKSKTGLNEEYMISNFKSAAEFARAWDAYKKSLP